MEYEIIYFDELSNECGKYRANWQSEINVIVGTGLEEGYEVWVRKVKNERLHKDTQETDEMGMV